MPGRMGPMDAQLDLIPGPAPLGRAEALERLRALEGHDLRPLADTYGITVWSDGRRNKGWAGQVVERHLGRSPNSDHGADFGSWELKVVPLVCGADGVPRLKETMAITMFTAADLESREFEDSHLLTKLRRLIVVARTYEGPDEARSLLCGAAAFDLDDPQLVAQVREDYEEIRWVVRESGAYALHGGIGRLVQPRPKGAGNWSGGMGFYARKALVAHMLGLQDDV